MRKAERKVKKYWARARYLAKKAEKKFKGLSDKQDHRYLFFCELCDGDFTEPCRFCKGAGVGITRWFDVDGSPMRKRLL